MTESHGFESLRKKAEEFLALDRESFDDMTELDVRRLIHDLRVHQIELEMQNEELVEARNKAEHNHQRLYELYHQAPIGYMSLDDRGMIIEANQTLAAMLALPMEKLLGRAISAFMPEAERQKFLSLYQGFYRHPEDRQLDTRLESRDGNKIIDARLEARKAKSILKTERQTTVLLVTVHDITPLKRTQQKLELAKDQAEKASQAKSEFLSQMSHEFRTPLNAILGFSQVLEFDETMPLTDSQREYNWHIYNAGKHLLELVDDVLNLARIEAGRIDVKLKNIQLLPLLKEATSLVCEHLQQREISLKFDEPNPGLLVKADYVRLKEILLNFLSNAIKYNYANGKIDLYCEQNERQDYVRISVKDTGKGLSDKQQKKLFEPFERLGAELSEVQGTGIGLTICKRLAEAMNGAVGVSSQLGVGSTFWVEIPLSDEDPLQKIADSKLANAPFKQPENSYKILYIEDNFANLKVIQEFFASKRHINLVTAMTPTEGLKLANHYQPDLILLDIQLPEMDGFKVFECLKSTSNTRRIPVIGVSAYAMPQDIEKAMNMGFYDYLPKPIDFKMLLEAIDNVA